MNVIKVLFDEWETECHEYGDSYCEISDNICELLSSLNKKDIDFTDDTQSIISRAVLPELEAAFAAGFNSALEMFTRKSR